MQYNIVSNYIFPGLLEILININNHKHCLIINAKFHSSTINNAHTMSPYDMSAAPQKSYGQQHSFQILSIFLYDICVGCWPANLGCQLMEQVQSITSKFTTMNLYY